MILTTWLAQQISSLLGWKMINNTLSQSLQKGVVIVAPHTSNWDFFYGMLFKFSHPTIPIKFAIKKEVMIFPFSFIFKALGAIPIDRGKKMDTKKSMVDKMVTMLDTSHSLMLVIAPEGTRSYVKRWKTGFYRIALAAKVPIILGYMDYKKKEMGMGPIFNPTGDRDKDMESIYEFYRSKPGKHSHKGVL